MSLPLGMVRPQHGKVRPRIKTYRTDHWPMVRHAWKSSWREMEERERLRSRLRFGIPVVSLSLIAPWGSAV